MLLSLTAIVACDREAPTEVRSGREPPSRVIEIGPVSAADDGINPNDTYVEQTQTVAETTTVTSSQPFHDPVTGQLVTSTTVGTQPQTVNVTAGYGYDGQPRITNGFQQTSGEETVWLRRVTDVTTDMRADGSDTQPFLYDPMGELGSLVGAQLEAGGGGGSGGGGDRCIIPSDCDTGLTGIPDSSATLQPFGAGGPSIRAIAGAERRSIARIGDGIRIQELLPEPSSAGLMAYRGSSASEIPTRTERRITRDFARRRGDWTLAHTMSEIVVRSAQTETRYALHLTVTAAKAHRNTTMDARRGAARAAPANGANGDVTAGAAVVAMAHPVARESCDPATAIIPCDNQSAPGTPSEPFPPDETTIQPGDFARAVGGAGPALVLQHGLFSDAATWTRMEGWLARDMSVSGVYRFTLPWGWNYERQAIELHKHIASTAGANPVIVIGHSNGGMVARYLARHPNTGDDPGNPTPKANIRGVITVGTPHQGAPLARYAPSVSRLLAFGGAAAFIACAWHYTAGCSVYATISSSSLGNIYNAMVSAAPVLTEMQARDGYHATFNAEPESFKRFGITSNSWSRWMPYRMYGDAYCYPESRCGGAAQVRRIDRIYKRDISCAIIGMLFGIYERAIRCVGDAVFLRVTDEIYRRYVDGGDGVVPAWSQKYPNLAEENLYAVDAGPSHVGETKDSHVGNRIERVLRDRLGVSGQVALAP